MAARASIVAEGGYHVFILICSARHSKGWRVFLFLFLAAVLAVAMFAMVDHGWIMLGDDALQARNCLKNYGVWKTYQEPTGAVHLLCQYPGQNKIYDVIQKWINGKWQEATAMSPKDGVWSAVQTWLLAKGGKFLMYPPNGTGY